MPSCTKQIELEALNARYLELQATAEEQAKKLLDFASEADRRKELEKQIAEAQQAFKQKDEENKQLVSATDAKLKDLEATLAQLKSTQVGYSRNQMWGAFVTGGLASGLVVRALGRR